MQKNTEQVSLSEKVEYLYPLFLPIYNLLRKIKHEIRSYASLAPSILPLFYRNHSNDAIITANTDIVIEGFGGSANTFARVAFEFAQTKEYVVASHLHTPSQVIKAVKLGIPTIVLIRDPLDVVKSLRSRLYIPSVCQTLKHYTRYYSTIYPLRNSYVIATYHDVTTDYGEVIHRTNIHFGTDFGLFLHNEDNVNLCFKKIGWAKPKANRPVRNIENIEKEIKDCTASVKVAQLTYHKFLGAS